MFGFSDSTDMIIENIIKYKWESNMFHLFWKCIFGRIGHTAYIPFLTQTIRYFQRAAGCGRTSLLPNTRDYM